MKRLMLCFCLLLGVSVHGWASHVHSTRAERALEQLITSSGTILVDVGEGGTGASSLTAHAVLLGNGTSTIQAIACTTANQVWQSGSPGSCTGAPTIGTSVTTPSLIGGTAVGSNITYKSTTGAGTTTGIAHQWTGGTDGATVIQTMLNNGNIGVQTSAPKAADASARTFQLGDNFIMQNVVGTQTLFANNAYYDGTWKRAIAAAAQAIRMQVGSIAFHFAPSGAADSTLTNWDSSDIKLYITIDGNIGLNTTSFGTSMTGGLSQGIGVVPSTFPADIIQWSVADLNGAATAGSVLYTEGGYRFESGSLGFSHYGLFTNATNYERLRLFPTAGTGITLAAETAGTGVDNLSVTLTPAGTGNAVAAIGAGGLFQVGATLRFAVTDGAASTGTRLRTAQATAPTCTTNCGTSPSISGSDTAMVVTLGTGAPASPVTVTFNGTWATAPACQAGNRTTAANNVTRVDSTTTTAVVYFAAGPAASDLVAVLCLGVS